MKSLLLATLALALAGLMVAWILKRFRVQSPVVHRLAWASVLAQGLFFAGIPIELPLLDPPAPMAELSSATALPPAASVTEPGLSVETAAPVSEKSISSSFPFRVGEVIAILWILGAGGTLFFFVLSYASLVTALRRSRPAPASWTDQWGRLLARRGVRKEVPLLVHDRLGPMLCRIPRGPVVVVPGETWKDLSETQRQAVLEHEIAHIQRGDIWKTLVARLAMVPHWFNPAAWWAVRQFEEAAEWACDRRLAREGNHAVEFARALLVLAEPKQPLPVGASLARGAALSPRIERLVGGGRKDSILKCFAILVLTAAIAVVTAIRFEVVAQETAPAPEMTDAAFDEKVDAFASDLDGSGEQLEAFRELLETPAGRIVMKDRAARAEQQLRQAAQANAFENFLDERFERIGEGDDLQFRLRGGEEQWKTQFEKQHGIYTEDIGHLQPVLDELAAKIDPVSEAEKLMLRLLGDEKAAALIYMTALQKQTRPDAYAIAEELGHVFAGDGEGGFEIPESRREAADGFIRSGLNLVKLSELVHEEFTLLSDEFAEPDDLHRRLRTAAVDSMFAAVVAYKLGKDTENRGRSVSAVFNEAMRKIDEAFIDRGDGLHFNPEADRSDLEELLDTYDAFRERGDMLGEPVREFAGMIAAKDELHEQWRTFVNSEVGLATLASSVEIGSARPGDLFRTMVGSVLEPSGKEKQRVQEERREEVIENMQKTLRSLRDARRRGREFERLAERIEDEDLREKLQSSPGKLAVGLNLRRRILTERYDGLETWIAAHFDRNDAGKLTPKASAPEAMTEALEDAREIAANLKTDF